MMTYRKLFFETEPKEIFEIIKGYVKERVLNYELACSGDYSEYYIYYYTNCGMGKININTKEHEYKSGIFHIVHFN